jgi:alkanesulfonate monooxygenase SsuD/methylene tetrahydromethanopterin reductase-like flavin-dependent oxidoreductase (luciferase family)
MARLAVPRPRSTEERSRLPASPKVYLRSYPVTDGMEARAYAVEADGWDGMLFTDIQNLSMEVFGSLYFAASATSRLELGTAVTNLVTHHPAVMASALATLHQVSVGRAHIGVGRGETALELVGINHLQRADSRRCSENFRPTCAATRSMSGGSRAA